MGQAIDHIDRNFKVITPNGLNTTNAVLVDGQSILSCREYPFDVPIYPSDVIFDDRDANNLIQNIIIYDHVLVDSVLLMADEKCRDICKNFPEAISAFRYDDEIREKLADELDSMLSKRSIEGELKRKLDLDDNECFYQYQRGEEVIHDVMSGMSFSEQVEARKYEFGGIPGKLLHTTNSVLRAHYYLELSRMFELFLSPSIGRSEYYSNIAFKKLGLPTSIIDYVDDKILSELSIPNDFFSVNIEVPPVAEWVLRTSKEKQTDIATAIHEARNSKNAKVFRKWCVEMSSEMKSGRAGIQSAQKIYKELEKNCMEWKEDINVGVKYKKRTLNFGKLPLFGKVFVFFGAEKITIKDPIIAGKKPYLLFLNNLYRA